MENCIPEIAKPLAIISLLMFKHFIGDFILQTKNQALHKHILWHPLGILHSLIHAVLTIFVLWSFTNPELVLIYAFLDGLTHYAIDFFKMNINYMYNLKPDNQLFWALVGLDQFMHYLTYFVITVMVVSGFNLL